MKASELQEMFKEYCRVKILTIAESHHEGEGDNRHYVTAAPCTVCLKPGDARLGKVWAIVQHGERGTYHVLYGFVSTERMAGYLDATLCR